MRRAWWFLLLFMSLSKAEEYQLGNGYKIPDIPLYIGGYVSLDYISRHDDYNRFRVDDVALITYGRHNRFSYLGEFEIKEGYIQEWGKREDKQTDLGFHVERLYVDYAYDDNVDLRIGKFNTPAGYWNLTPISVLRDAASNPYLAYIVYPRYTTGAQFSYENHLEGGNAYTVALQHNHDIYDDYNNIYTKKHALLGIEHIYDYLSIKANAGYFQTADDEDFYYFLLAALYEQDRYNLSAEFGARRNDTRWSVPYAFYMQGVYHLAPRHDLISRFESYKIDEGAYRREEIGVIGYTYRPKNPIAYKAEYQWHSYINESRLKLSFSIMF